MSPIEPGKSIPEGYHVGFLVSIQGSWERNLECEVCHRLVYSLVRLERDYPKDADIHACSQCIEEAGL